MGGWPVVVSGTDDADPADLPKPSERPVLTTSQLAGPRLKPSQILRVYSPDEWEEFVLEWANCLTSEYHSVKRYSGAGDRGRDVVGFVTPDGLKGDWDCFQCKHYEHALHPTDAYPEIAKIINGVAEGYFKLPRRYRFVAPKGVGPSLSHLLSDNDQLHAALLKALSDDGSLKHLDKDVRLRVTEALPSIDLSVFDSEQLDSIIEAHRRSPYHLFRFGGQLEPRPPSPEPPDEITDPEACYVGKLLDAYRERVGNSAMTLDDVAVSDWHKDHLSRQRISFFSAEALRSFARDKVPPRTYEALQAEIYEGVVETEQSRFADGLDRLKAVLDRAGQVQLDENALISVSRQPDRKGICHQLANDGKLTWVRDIS